MSVLLAWMHLCSAKKTRCWKLTRTLRKLSYCIESKSTNIHSMYLCVYAYIPHSAHFIFFVQITFRRSQIVVYCTSKTTSSPVSIRTHWDQLHPAASQHTPSTGHPPPTASHHTHSTASHHTPHTVVRHAASSSALHHQQCVSEWWGNVFSPSRWLYSRSCTA